LGFEELRKICSIILLTSLEDRPAYLAVQALTRARMCESLCVRAGCECGDTCFLAVLLSVVDILLGIPLAECLRRLPLSDALRDALLHHEGAAGAALSCATDYERSRCDCISFRQLPRTQISDAYAEA